MEQLKKQKSRRASQRQDHLEAEDILKQKHRQAIAELAKVVAAEAEAAKDTATATVLAARRENLVKQVQGILESLEPPGASTENTPEAKEARLKTAKEAEAMVEHFDTSYQNLQDSMEASSARTRERLKRRLQDRKHRLNSVTETACLAKLAAAQEAANLEALKEAERVAQAEEVKRKAALEKLAAQQAQEEAALAQATTR